MRPRISQQSRIRTWNKPRLTVVSCLHLSLSLSYMCLTPFSLSLATGFTGFGVAWEGQDLSRGTLQKGIQIHSVDACYRVEPDVCAPGLFLLSGAAVGDGTPGHCPYTAQHSFSLLKYLLFLTSPAQQLPSGPSKLP